MKRNVVLLTVDSLRADHCGFNGSEYDLTPKLDELADNGLVFENAFAPGPRTPSSMPVLLTGAFPPEQSGPFSWQNRWDRIRKHLSTHQTVAEYFQQQGYTTVGITTNPWTHGNGFATGFDHYIELSADDMEDQSLGFRALEHGIDLTRFGERFDWKNAREWLVQWQNIYNQIADGIETARENEPYFLWLFLLDSHQPYIMPREYRVESNAIDIYLGTFQENRKDHEELDDRTMGRLRRSYRDSIRSTDSFVARLHEEVTDDDPVFIFHSDHGEAFGEHGKYGHKQELYDENLHVPFLVHGIDRSERVEDLVSLRTLPAVTSQLAEDDEFDPSQFTTDFVYATTEDTGKWAVRDKYWKLIGGEDQSLFDLWKDPEEQTNSVTEYPEVSKELDLLLANRRSDAAEKRQVEQAITTLRPFRSPVVGEQT
jgi:arylsulfatase